MAKTCGNASFDAIFFIEGSLEVRSSLMRNSMRLLVVCGLVGFGYFLGSCHVDRIVLADAEEELPSDDSVKKITDAHNALKTAAQQLTIESRYSSVTKAINPYSILVGGLNVKEDLAAGHGVDPETFAALNVAAYDLKKNPLKGEKSDAADDNALADWIEVKLLTFDANGRLMYDGKLVKVYSISRLRKLNAQRTVILNGAKDRRSPK